MRRRVVLAIAFVALAGTVSNYWRHSRPVDIAEIKREALKHRQQGDLRAFVAVLDKVPEGSRDKPRAYLEQGRAYWELSRGVDMEAVLNRCIALEANLESPTEETVGAWGTLGDHYVGQERFDEARDVIWQVFQARARQGRQDAFYLLLLLRLRYESAEPAIAIEKLRQFLASDATDYESHRALGIYLTRIGELDEARQHLELAVNARGDVPRFLRSWIDYLFHTSDISSAEEVLADLPGECEGRAEFWVYRGKVADYQQDWNAAIDDYQNAIELEPGRLDANHLLAQAYRRAGKKSEFERCVAHCQELGTAFRKLSDHYTRLHTRRGTNPDAETSSEISELCRQLGWDREAEAWASLHRPSR